MTTFIQTVEADVQDAINWVDHEAISLWHLVKPLFIRAEGIALADLQHFIAGVLSAVGTNKDLATLEADVLNALQVYKGSLFTLAQQLGSDALQVLIGLVKGSLTTAK